MCDGVPYAVPFYIVMCFVICAVSCLGYFAIIFLKGRHLELELNFFLALLSGLILVIVGLLDDILNLSPKIRIFAQLLLKRICYTKYSLKGLLF